MMIGFDKALTTLENASNEFTTSFSNLIYYLTLSTSYFNILSFICIGIGSFVLFIVIFSIVIFSCRAKDKCHFSSWMTNVCTAFLSFSSFLLGIVVIVFVAINFIIASMCDYSYQASINPDIALEVSRHFSKNLEGLLSADCLRTEGLKLTEFIDINDPGLSQSIDDIGLFLDGFSNYNNFLWQIPSDSYNNNILKISEEWEQYRIGEKLNFSNTTGISLFVLIFSCSFESEQSNFQL